MQVICVTALLMSCSLNLLGLALGVMVIAELVRRRTPSRLFWSVVEASLAMTAFVFHASEPLAHFDDFTTVLDCRPLCRVLRRSLLSTATE